MQDSDIINVFIIESQWCTNVIAKLFNNLLLTIRLI